MMDTRDGKIYTEAEVEAMNVIDRQYVRPMGRHPTPEERARRKVGRNDPCPCGSGKKFKKCCEWRAGLEERVEKLQQRVAGAEMSPKEATESLRREWERLGATLK
jgi:hypothetical protein